MERWKRKLRAAFAFAVVFVASLTLSQRADALPIFARKYHTSCMTCHEMFPRLNAFGEAFRLNGYIWPGGPEADAEQRKQEPIPLGAESYKQAFPDAVWPTELPEGVPLSIRGIGTYAQHVASSSPDQARVFETEWELQTAGNLGESLSWFGHTNFVMDTTDAAKVQLVAHPIALLNIEGLVGWRLLNLQLGTVAVEESDYYHYRNHSTHQLLPAEARPLAGIDTVPYPGGFAKPDLFKLRRGPGAMFWGTTARSDYSIGYRIGDDLGGGQDQNVGFFHWAYKFGGMDHYGRTAQNFAQGYMENSLAVGVFGDYGQVDVQPTPTAAFSADKFWRGGADFVLKVESWALRGGAYRGSHSNPYGALDTGRVDYTNWFAQTEYHVLPWLLGEVRYEKTYWSVPSTVHVGQTDRARIVPSINVLYGANVRFTIWGEIYTQQRASPKGDKLDAQTVGLLVDWGI